MTRAGLKVRDYLTRSVITVTPETEITRAVSMLIGNDVSGLVVTDGADHVLGILTERDCIRTATQSGYFDELGGPVSDFMSAPAISVSPDDDLVEIAMRFVDSKYRRFPVVENGRLVGIICRRDVLRALLRSPWFAQPGL
ncbi:MAG: CBS domain-containing protein [Xanthomonadales bacterium]|nr:CBS domain-containing protein [Xanthomonadales bacterium]